MNGYLWLAAYVLLLSVVSFALMGIDKRRAKRDRRRIPERTLFLSAILGGSPGTILGMRAFRHKTRHRSFTIGLPAILIVQLVLLAAFRYWQSQAFVLPF